MDGKIQQHVYDMKSKALEDQIVERKGQVFRLEIQMTDPNRALDLIGFIVENAAAV